MEQADDKPILEQVRNYRKIVLIYEALNQKIQELLEPYGSSADKLPKEELEQYRLYAQQRDELQNEIRWLEEELLNLDE